jgi:hypothetical protein
LEHYIPEPGVQFNYGKQPVLLMPGLLGNSNEFDIHTPDNPAGMYQVSLPEELPDWAKDDQYIKRDPMKFYSMAYYLYSQGYDVWLANYRGEGAYRQAACLYRS